MKAPLLLICLLGFISSLLAQKEDYAISNKGDSVWGKHRAYLVGQHILETDSGNGRIQLYSYLMNHSQNISTRQEELKRLFDDKPAVLEEFEKTKGLKYKTVLEMVKKYKAASIN